MEHRLNEISKAHQDQLLIVIFVEQNNPNINYWQRRVFYGGTHLSLQDVGALVRKHTLCGEWRRKDVGLYENERDIFLVTMIEIDRAIQVRFKLLGQDKEVIVDDMERFSDEMMDGASFVFFKPDGMNHIWVYIYHCPQYRAYLGSYVSSKTTSYRFYSSKEAKYKQDQSNVTVRTGVICGKTEVVKHMKRVMNAWISNGNSKDDTLN